jgi:hypothetical protein
VYRSAIALVRKIFLVGAVASLALPALAADPRPDEDDRIKLFEASVLLDDKMHADPALVSDCLAEGKKWLDKIGQHPANKGARAFGEGPWSFERKYSVRSVVADRYVSIVRSDYMDTHGAHPNTDLNTILWDKAAQKRISIRPFFTETADNGPTMTAILKAVIAALKAEKKKRDATDTATAEWFKGLEPKLLRIGAVALVPSIEAGKSSGLLFYYPPYAVGPYAEGAYTAFVPWEVLKLQLSSDGAAIFGGARPKGDDDEAQ